MGIELCPAYRMRRGSRSLAGACSIAGATRGGYSFAAIDSGAARVDGFDVRGVNVEKARFVARVRGIENVNFEVSSCDEWLARGEGVWDYVFLCGLLYHLVEPWRTLEEFRRRARRGIFLTCVLNGGEDGYTPFPESENIAASEDPSEMSMMPNTSRTIMEELVKHGFQPALVSESRSTNYWGGCSLFFRRLCGVRYVDLELEGREHFDVYLGPGRNGVGYGLMVYNRSPEARSVSGTLIVRDAGGNIVHTIGPGPLELEPRVHGVDDDASTSAYLDLDIDPQLPIPATVEIEIRSPDRGSVLTRRVLRVEQDENR